MTQFIGRYRILAEIGAGGMGTVYRALDSEIEREVALKWLPGHFSRDNTFVERFKREARVIGRLEHPHIVPIYDVGEHEGRPFIVMRLLKGGTLRERIRRTDFDIDTLLTTLQQVADALEVAHGRGIIHRDIKPSNILFDERGAAFLSDFGIAKVLDAATQLTGSGVIGTPSYMSPEQFKGGNIGGRSDQYSLAVVAFEALAGRLPFEGETTAQVMFKHLTEVPPELHTVASHVPPSLSPVLKRALSKEPEDRYESVQTFVRALRQAAAGDPTLLGESLTMVEPVTPATPPAGAGPAAHAPATTAKMDHHYQEGLEAMNRGDWQRAVNAFDEVLAIDPTYAATRTLRQQAAQQLTQVSRTAAGSAAPPVTPPPGTAVSPGGQGGIPRIAKIAALAFAGLLGLAIMAGLAFVVFRALGSDDGGQETPVAAAAGQATATENATAPPTREPTPAEEAVALQPTPTASPTTEPTPSPEPTSALAYMAIESAGSGAGYRSAGEDTLTALDSGDKVLLEPGTVLQAGRDVLSFALPNDAHVYLAPATEVELPSNPPDLQRPSTIMRLNDGVLLLDATAVTEEEIFIYRGLPGALADIDNGIMGVTFDAEQELFAVDCFEGECLLSSSSDTIRLEPNQFSELAAGGAPTAADVARITLYCDLAPSLLSCPQATSTPTVPPPTFTPTFPPPTATQPPPTQPPPTQPPPTQPPPTQPPPTQPPPTQPPPTYTPEPP
ncbi:MAG: protein kinase [Candidatus Promineifilaceae bacterium]|nr:protein kinase [Candidatus Promineifilaceae bacterium]